MRPGGIPGTSGLREVHSMGTNAMETVYFGGEFIPRAKAAISPDDRGFLFSDGVYEVVRAYGGRLFELERHVARLGRSLRAMRIQGVALAEIGTGCVLGGEPLLRQAYSPFPRSGRRADGLRIRLGVRRRPRRRGRGPSHHRA